MADDFIRSDGIKIELIPEPYCTWCSKPISKNYLISGLCYNCNQKRRNSEMPIVKVNAVGIYMLRTANTQLSKEILKL